MDCHALPAWRAFRIVFADWILDVQLASVCQLQYCSCGELLAQRRDLKFCLRRVGYLPFLNCRTITSFKEYLAVPLDYNNPTKVFGGTEAIDIRIGPFFQIL